MPYFVYHVKEKGLLPDPNRLEMIDRFEKFPEASRRARELRGQGGEGGNYRVIFANNPAEAEDLLLNEQPAVHYGDD